MKSKMQLCTNADRRGWDTDSRKQRTAPAPFPLLATELPADSCHLTASSRVIGSPTPTFYNSRVNIRFLWHNWKETGKRRKTKQNTILSDHGVLYWLYRNVLKPKSLEVPGVVVPLLIPALGKSLWVQFSEASLVYTVNFRTARAMQRDSIS